MTGTASAGSNPGPNRDANAAYRRPQKRSRAIALLLFVLLVCPACEEVLSTDNENTAPREQQTVSDAEINRAARGEGGSENEARVAAEPTVQERAPEDSADTTPTAARRVVESTFVHRAEQENSRGDYTYLSDPSIDGDPGATVFAAPTAESGHDHNIGVWFEPRERKWAIFNQDIAAMPGGAAFEVVVPPEDEALVHRSTPENASEQGTYIDHPLLNGKPEADPSVTQNWNPGGGGGVYNDHPVGIRYNAERERWEVFNRDDTAIPEGAAFNVTVAEAARTINADTVDVDTGEAPQYRDFYSEGDPQTPATFVSSDSSTGAIPVVKPFNFGRDPGGPEDKTMSVTIPKIGVEDIPVFDTVSEERLRDGVVHIPATGYPWQDGANVFIAGHRIGFENTPSYYVFFRLDELREGDEIQLQDANGRQFVYRVSNRTVVGPDSVDVMNAVEGKSLITLQTCTLPDYKDRLIVQGTLVEQTT